MPKSFSAPDLLAATAELVSIPSVSHAEGPLVDHLEARLRRRSHLEVERVGLNLVARTHLDRSMRVILAGHTDTVPVNGNADARIDGDVLWGLGSADMKGGLAVMLALAEAVADPAVDVTYVFYAGEEVAAEHNGLAHLVRDRPDLLAGDVAILGEPTGGELEAGCQGTLRMEISLGGQRAHTARPWMGRNAIHRLGALLRLVEGFDERRPVIQGCEYREALQAVVVSGGVAAQRRPRPRHRHAQPALRARPHRGRSGRRGAFAPRARPRGGGRGHGRRQRAGRGSRSRQPDPPRRSSIGTTSRSPPSSAGPTSPASPRSACPRATSGPGDPTLAHTADERVDRASLERAYDVLHAVLTTPPAG